MKAFCFICSIPSHEFERKAKVSLMYLSTCTYHTPISLATQKWAKW